METPQSQARDASRDAGHSAGDAVPAHRSMSLEAKVDALWHTLEDRARSRLQFLDGTDSEMDQDSDSNGLLEYWQILRRRKLTILLLAFLGALGGLLISFPQTPVYQVHTSLEIQGVNENFLNMTNASPTLSAASYYPDYEIQTQVRIFQSQSLIGRVLTKLKAEPRPPVAALPDRFSAWRKALGLSSPTPVSLRQSALAMAAASLRVRTSGQNRIVELSSDSTDPNVAAEFTNALANEFIEQNLEGRWNTSQRTGEWLSRQMQDLKIKLEKSEDQLQAYARASGLMFTSEKENVVEEKLKQLQEELSKGQADRVMKQSRYELAVSTPVEALPEVLDSDPLSDYQLKLAELRRQRAEQGASLTPAHYKMKRVEAQIEELESSMKKARGNILDRIRNEYDSAQRRERLLALEYATQAKLVSEQAAKAIHYNILKREVDTSRQLYDAMLQKVKEAGITSAMRASNVRVIDPAEPPGGPYKPNLPMNGMLGLLTGIFVGIVFVLVQERADRTLRAPGDSSASLNMPELGAIPSIRADSVQQPYGYEARDVVLSVVGLSKPNGQAAEGAAGASTPSNGQNERVELITWQRKPSLLAESFRATLTSILFSGQNGSRPRVIVLTSASPSEGKTTVVSNLGIALAEINRRVLVIDADLRKPRQHDIFNVPNTWGLTDLLREKNSIEECPLEALVRQTEIPFLYLLPSGPGTVSISNLLYSARMPELLRRFRREFDTVLIDTPPMMQISDARVLGQLADAVILVLRAGHTTRDTAIAAKQRFAGDGTPVLGTILNNWDPKAGSTGRYGDHYGNYYGYGSGTGSSA